MIKSHTKLALIHGQHLFRKMLSAYLSQQENLEIIADAQSIEELIHKFIKAPPDIVLADISLAGYQGEKVLSAIKNNYPDTKVIIVSLYKDLKMISDFLDLGIFGYISKNEDPEELVKAIESASDNKIYRNKIITDALYWKTESNTNTTSIQNHIMLDDREKYILQLIWEEKNTKEIADSLFLSIRSIEKIRQDLKGKLGIKSTVGLLKYGLRKNLFTYETDIVKHSAI